MARPGQDWWSADTVDGWPRRKGRKERRKVRRLALPHGRRRRRKVCKLDDGRWKAEGRGLLKVCRVSKIESPIMGCRLMAIVVWAPQVFSGPMITCGVWSVPGSHKEALRNGWHLARAGLLHHKQGPGTLSVEEGNVSKPYTTQFTLAPLWKPRLLYA